MAKAITFFGGKPNNSPFVWFRVAQTGIRKTVIFFLFCVAKKDGL